MSTTPRQSIQLLSPSIVSLIAAGEVIERPATIVKELLENSLDADATEIQITLEDGGRQRIFVSDNGQGIPAEELELALQQHTTNKLRTTLDFEQLHSYGFRGEALFSIATMSKLTLRSRPQGQELGTEVTVNHGKFGQPAPIGMTPGTQVLVEQIFAKIPARRKFLKSALQERRSILDTVTRLAISVPEVGISVTEENKLLFSAPAEQTLAERLRYIFGEEFANQLWPFEYQTPGVSLMGVLGSPQLARRSQPYQFVIVNRRPVTSPVLITAVREAYGSSLEPKSAPAFVLFLQINPAEVDVNVHPRKETVQWQKESDVIHQVRTTLQNHLNVQYQPVESEPLVVRDSTSEAPFTPFVAKTLPQLHTTLKSSAPQWYQALASREQTILQIHDTYLLTETEQGLMIIDQHAAHERVLYQQFLELFHQQLGQKMTFELSPPKVIHLSPAASALLEEHLETFANIGCQIEPFGDQTFAVRTVPELLKEHNPQKVIESVLEDIQNDVALIGVDQLAHRTLAYLACRSAVKAGDPLTQDQAKVLLEKLQETSFAFSCPHGRPTIRTYTWGEIEKWFARK